MEMVERAQWFKDSFLGLEEELGKVLVGQHLVVRRLLTALFCRGNVLLEGVPGLGKTLLVRSLGKVMELRARRIQFTPDLMPADLTGTSMLMKNEDGHSEIRFRKGPIFANLVLADEVNRATPKTQSALLEAMQEHSVTIGNETMKLTEPFFVIATQNPLEMEGTYPLPEAQLDRFFFKVLVKYPSEEELAKILRRTTGEVDVEAMAVLKGEEVASAQELVKLVPAAPEVLAYAAKLVKMTHPDCEQAPAKVKEFVRYGASPRGAQALLLAGKVAALLDGRPNVSFADLEDAALPALRHRVIRNFEGEAEGVTTCTIVEAVVQQAKEQRG